MELTFVLSAPLIGAPFSENADTPSPEARMRNFVRFTMTFARNEMHLTCSCRDSLQYAQVANLFYGFNTDSAINYVVKISVIFVPTFVYRPTCRNFVLLHLAHI